MDLGIEGEYSDRERGVATAGSVTIRRWWNEAPPPPQRPLQEVSPKINGAFRDPDWSAILASYPDWQLAGVLPWNLGLGLRLSTPERRCVRRDILKLTC